MPTPVSVAVLCFLGYRTTVAVKGPLTGGGDGGSRPEALAEPRRDLAVEKAKAAKRAAELAAASAGGERAR